MQQVAFRSEEIELAGHLYVAENHSVPTPGVVIIGPMTYVKEQAPTEYARRLAARGLTALVFDARYHGESGGKERRWENPLAKVADIKAALSFLSSQAEVDPGKLIGLGICQGSSEMIRALAEDDRFKVGATIAGHYRDYDADLEWLGAEAREVRLERGWRAKLKYRETGEVDYGPAIDQTSLDVGMPGEFVWKWYKAWEPRGWENRYAVMSDADLLSYESLSAAGKLRKPYLMVHSDQSFLPDAARRHFDTIASLDKRILWEGQTPHFSYYDQSETLDATTTKIAEFFHEVVG